jgi:hypothetical protein
MDSEKAQSGTGSNRKFIRRDLYMNISNDGY